MTLDEALNYFKSPVKLCLVLRATHQNLYYWRKKGALPALQQHQLHIFTEGKLKIDKQYVIPKDILDYTFHTTTRKRRCKSIQ